MREKTFINLQSLKLIRIKNFNDHCININYIALYIGFILSH